ncbi:hypothetical protein Emag_007435 [Eimeria magna]
MIGGPPHGPFVRLLWGPRFLVGPPKASGAPDLEGTRGASSSREPVLLVCLFSLQ